MPSYSTLTHVLMARPGPAKNTRPGLCIFIFNFISTQHQIEEADEASVVAGVGYVLRPGWEAKTFSGTQQNTHAAHIWPGRELFLQVPDGPLTHVSHLSNERLTQNTCTVIGLVNALRRFHEIVQFSGHLKHNTS